MARVLVQPHARTCSIASWLLIPRAAPLAGPGRDRLPCTQAGGSRLCAGLVQLQAAWHGRYQKCPRRSGCVGRITPSRRPLLPHIACPVLHASLCARPLILRAAAPWQRVLGWQLCLYAARDGAPRAAASPPCPQRVSPCQRPPPPPPSHPSRLMLQLVTIPSRSCVRFLCTTALQAGTQALDATTVMPCLSSAVWPCSDWWRRAASHTARRLVLLSAILRATVSDSLWRLRPERFRGRRKGLVLLAHLCAKSNGC